MSKSRRSPRGVAIPVEPRSVVETVNPPAAATGPTAAPAGPPSPWERGLFPALLAWTFVSLIYPLYDTDFWWHLKTGELILRDGAIPQVDWYTYTDADKPWIDLHWGFQILIAVLHRLGGVNLVIVVKAAVITAAVAVGWLAAGRSIPPWLKALLWILPVIAISGRGYERPEMLSQLFLAGWLFVAFRVEAQPRLIWLLPAIQLVWVNCHALFVLGLVVGVCFVADRLVREWRWSGRRKRWGLELPPELPSFSNLIRVGGLVALACFASPYFEAGALFPLTLYRKFTVEQEFYSRFIGEFKQPIAFMAELGPKEWYGLTNMYLASELGVWLLTASSFIWSGSRTRRWSMLRLLLFVAFSHLAWEATRNVNIFSLVSAVILCANVGDAVSSPSVVSLPRRRAVFTSAVGAGLACLIALVVAGAWNKWGEENKPFGLGESEAWFIHDAAKFAGQPGFPERAFVANNGQAAVYSYYNARERLVFMDGRLEVCSLTTFNAFNEVLARMAQADPSWKAIITPEGEDPPIVILDSRGSRAQINGMLNTPGWRLVFADPSAAVFLDSALAEKLDLPRADPEPLMHPPGTRPSQPK